MITTDIILNVKIKFEHYMFRPTRANITSLLMAPAPPEGVRGLMEKIAVMVIL